MIFKICTPYELQEYEVVWVEINTPDGNFVIQKEHVPTLFIVSPEKEIIFKLRTGKQEVRILKDGGILEVTRTEALLIVDV